MINQILADYYEEKGFINKSIRLRRRNSLIIYGRYIKYNADLDFKYNYGYTTGNGWFKGGAGYDYISADYNSADYYGSGNGSNFRW